MNGFAVNNGIKKENEELIHQIEQLSVDINWLRKGSNAFI